MSSEASQPEETCRSILVVCVWAFYTHCFCFLFVLYFASRLNACKPPLNIAQHDPSPASCGRRGWSILKCVVGVDWWPLACAAKQSTHAGWCCDRVLKKNESHFNSPSNPSHVHLLLLILSLTVCSYHRWISDSRSPSVLSCFQTVEDDSSCW